MPAPHSNLCSIRLPRIRGHSLLYTRPWSNWSSLVESCLVFYIPTLAKGHGRHGLFPLIMSSAFEVPQWS